MAIYLVQHGKAMPKEQDPEQGLSAEGRAAVEKMAGVAKDQGIKVNRIEHSPKARARQTAEIFSEALGPPGGVAQRNGIKPLDEVAPVAAGLTSGDDLMLVGHLPFMERLAALLVTGSAEPPVIKFHNGGIVCLDDSGPDGRWIIKWALVPQVD